MALDPQTQESILGSLIPDVYINAITLESSGSPVVEDNPHVESAREEKKEKPKEQLVVTVDLSLKERLDDSLISSWFGEQEFTKYLKIKLIQSTRNSTTKLLTDNKNVIVYRPQNDQEFKEHEQYIETRDLNVAQDVLGDATNLALHRKSVDANGTVIHDINYRGVFYVGSEKPKHLAYFAVSYLDMEQLIEDYGLKVESTDLNKMNGKVASDIAIHNRKVVSSAWIYRTKDGYNWSGPVHKQDKIIMTGSKPHLVSEPLTRFQVPNSKVHDFRDVKEVERLQVDMSVFGDSLMKQNNPVRLLTNDNMDVKKKRTYFTDIHIARDADGTARFTFGLDFKRYVKENSIYGKLFDNASESLRRDIFQSATIRTMKIYRRRIRNSQTLNRLGSAWHGEVIWDKSETPVLVAISGEKTHKAFVSNESPAGSLKEVSYVLKKNSDMEDMRFFTVMDKTVKHITDGHYQYGVEIEVEDGSFKYLLQVVNQLRERRRELMHYLDRGSKPGMTKFIAAISDPHIDHPSERAILHQESDGAYDISSNRFTNKFYQQETASFPNSEAAPWFRPAWEYLKAVQMLTNNVPADRWEELLSALTKIINPQSGSPKGVLAVLGLYNNLISKISRILALDTGTRTTRTIETPKSPHTKVSGKTSKTAVKIFRDEKWFARFSFDSNVQKHVGLRYLWMGEVEAATNTDGLKQVDGGYYQARAVAEIHKDFKSLEIAPNLVAGSTVITEGDSLETTSFTYLTPATIELGTKVVDLKRDSLHNAYSDEYYSQCEAEILCHTSGIQSSDSQSSQAAGSSAAQSYSQNMSNLFSEVGLTILPGDSWEPIALTDHLQNRHVSTAVASGTLLPPDPPKVIDPIVKIHGSATCEADPWEDTNANPNSVFLGLQRFFVEAGTLISGTTTGNQFLAASGTEQVSTSPKSSSGPVSSAAVDTNTISLYDLNTPGNAVDLMGASQDMVNAVATANGVGHLGNVDLQLALTTLPNSVKGLFYGSTTPSNVRHDWHGYDNDPLKSLKTVSMFRLHHNLISQILVLEGFDDGSGIRHVKKEKWVPLTKLLWENSAGEGLLCKIKKWESPELGIRWTPVTRELPIYDEYFILVPPNPAVAANTSTSEETHPVDNGPGAASSENDSSMSEGDNGETNTNHNDC